MAARRAAEPFGTVHRNHAAIAAAFGWSVWLLACVLLTLGALPVRAQISLPGTADPLRLQGQQRGQPTPRTGGQGIQVEEPELVLPDGADEIRFPLREVQLEGNTVYDAEALASAWEALLNREVSLAELYKAAAAITLKYRTDGYILSRAIVPAQDIEDGVVRLQVIEGYVGEVTITGQVGRDALLRGYADKIIASRPLQVDDLERYLLLMDDLTGTTAASVLAPLPGEPGAASLTIELQHKVLDTFATFDNRGTRFIGPFQASVGGRLNSALGFYELSQLRLIGTPMNFDELRAYDFSQTIPIDNEGTMISVGINQALARPGFTLKPLRIGSEATVLNTQISHPLLRNRARNVQVSLGFTATDLRTDLLGGTTLLLNDRIRTFSAALVWDFVDEWDGINILAAQISHGVDILGARTAGAPNLSRANGRSNFMKITGDAQRVQSLGGDWSMLAGLTFQYGFDSLLASEQIGLGGNSYLRAYDPGELTGDRGVAAKLELQYNQKPGLPWLGNFQLYGFFDAGRVWNKSPLAGERPAASGTAAGAGMRFTLTEQISGTLEVAKPLTRSVATEGDKEPRVFFGLVARF